MSSRGYHEPIEQLSAATRDMHRALVSLAEEIDAIDGYNQRANVCEDIELKAIIEHNRDDEKEHAAMLLEWIRRRDTRFSEQIQGQMFAGRAIEQA